MIKALVVSDFRHYHTARPEAEIFIGLKQRGIDITIATPLSASYVERFKNKNIRVIGLYPEKQKAAAIIPQLRDLIRKESYDLVHAASRQSLFAILSATKGLPCKIISYKGYTGNISWLYPRSYRQHLNPRVDAVICNAQAVADALCRQVTFHCKKAVVIHKGHDPSWYDSVVPVTRSDLGIGPETLVLVCAANNRRFKGMPYFLKAVAALPPGLDLHFVLMGNGLDTKSIRRRIARTDYRSSFTLTGYVEDSLPYVAAADCFVLPSLYGESLTKAVIEAMCLRVTPVITDIPGNVALLEHGKSGLKVPVKNPAAIAKAIQTLYHDRDMCQRLGQNARQHIQQTLHHDKTVQQVYSLYSRIAVT